MEFSRLIKIGEDIAILADGDPVVKDSFKRESPGLGLLFIDLPLMSPGPERLESLMNKDKNRALILYDAHILMKYGSLKQQASVVDDLVKRIKGREGTIFCFSTPGQMNKFLAWWNHPMEKLDLAHHYESHLGCFMPPFYAENIPDEKTLNKVIISGGDFLSPYIALDIERKLLECRGDLILRQILHLLCSISEMTAKEISLGLDRSLGATFSYLRWLWDGGLLRLSNGKFSFQNPVIAPFLIMNGNLGHIDSKAIISLLKNPLPDRTNQFIPKKRKLLEKKNHLSMDFD